MEVLLFDFVVLKLAGTTDTPLWKARDVNASLLTWSIRAFRICGRDRAEEQYLGDVGAGEYMLWQRGRVVRRAWHLAAGQTTHINMWEYNIRQRSINAGTKTASRNEDAQAPTLGWLWPWFTAE